MATPTAADWRSLTYTWDLHAVRNALGYLPASITATTAAQPTWPEPTPREEGLADRAYYSDLYDTPDDPDYDD